jgi:LysR family transcriptional regulator, carnitine catabolism transcriptional activator
MRRLPSLPSLKAFISVARARSFVEAARSLHVSQPALSRTIHLLEDQLGTRLFDRDTRNVSLTAAGEALLPVVERLSGDYEHAFSELARTFAGERGRVVVGALPSIASLRLPRLIAGFQRGHPGVEIVVRDTLSRSLEQQFIERQVDLGLIALAEPIPQLQFQPVFSEPFGLVCRAGGELDTGQAAEWKLFTAQPFIAMAPLSSVRNGTDEAFARARLAIRPWFECSHLATLGGLIAEGLGVSALPRSTLPLLGPGRFAWRSLRRPVVARTVGLARLARRTLPPAAEAFAAYVLENLSGPASAG